MSLKDYLTENDNLTNEELKFLGIEQKILYTDDTLPTGNKKKQKHYVYNINQSTLENVKNNLKINYILCKNTSRWTRRGNQELIYTLRANGIYIYFKDENIDTFNRESDTLLGIIQQLDRNKSIDTSKKVKSGFEASIKLKKIRTRICRERSEKNSKRGRNTGHSIYSKKILCGICNEWYSQNGEKNKNGEYIKKMNCSNKKKNGLKVCNNNNLSFKEIERRYKELQENFESFIKMEKWKQKKELLFTLIPIFEYYFSSSEEQIEELKTKITDINTLADELMIQRIGLTPSALTLYNDRLNALAEEREKLLKELDYIYKYYDKIRPFIDNILNALDTLEKLDETKKVCIEELLNYDIIMINYYDKYEWKINLISLEETYNFFEDIGIDVNLYMGNYEKYDPTKEELNKMLSKFYKEYKADKEYYF